MWREAWSQKEDALRQRYMRHMEKLDSGSRLLEPLRHGDRCWVQNQAGRYANKWDKSGTVVETHPHDQYTVKVDGSGRLTLRNRQFLRKIVSHDLFGHSKQTPTPGPGPTSDFLPPPSGLVSPQVPDPESPKQDSRTSTSTPPVPDMPGPTVVPATPPATPHRSPSTPDSMYHTPRQLRFEDEPPLTAPAASPARPSPLAHEPPTEGPQGPTSPTPRRGILKKLEPFNKPGLKETPQPAGRTRSGRV